jgi:ferritin-like metal-binding protein YciE
MESVQELLEEQLKDLYNAEKQLTKALPAMAKKASTPTLKEAFTSHLEETKGHVQRLEQIGESLEMKLTGKTCKAMEGLIEEGKEVIAEKGNSLVLDAALIAAAQRVEHYEISAYGSARALAEKLGQTEAVDLLQETLDEESAADEKLNTISLEEVLPEAPTGQEEEEEDDDNERVTAQGQAEPVAASASKGRSRK